MLLSSITKHVRAQNWFAVFIDFCIVVVGVFIGIEVANWNATRAVDAKERELLVELKHDIENDIFKATVLSDHFANVHAAAKRSIAFMDRGESCGDECWPVLADFFHASHWFPVAVKRATFEAMRSQGLPRSLDIVSAVEDYFAQNQINALVLNELPTYREIVRSLLTVSVLEAYWSSCWTLDAGIETIRYEDCPQKVSNEVAEQTVNTIINHEGIRPSLTFWLSEVTPTASELKNQNEKARHAIRTIDHLLASD